MKPKTKRVSFMTNKQFSELSRQVSEEIKKRIGDECTEHAYGCFTCDTYIMLGILNRWIELQD